MGIMGIFEQLKIAYQKNKGNYIPPIVGFTLNEKFNETLLDLVTSYSKILPALTTPFEGPVGAQFCRICLNFMGSDEDFEVFKMSVRKLMLNSLYCWGFTIYSVYVDSSKTSENEFIVNFYYSYDDYTDNNIRAWYCRLSQTEQREITKSDLRDNALERELMSNGL